jgi:hypothetical protein
MPAQCSTRFNGWGVTREHSMPKSVTIHQALGIPQDAYRMNAGPVSEVKYG